MELPLSENESDRLRTLHYYDILDTPAEDEFDDFTRLAAHICGTPIALISLVDENRQWFKSRYGLEALETPRDVSFCAHAIEQPHVFVVPDASMDERFSDNPLVTGDLNVQFYAGAPLLAPDGQALGALCVIDYKPRTLTATQEEALAALSRQVIARIQLRRELSERAHTERALRLSEARKAAILVSALDCIVTIDQEGRVIEWNPAAEWTFGYLADEALGCDISELIIPPTLRMAHLKGMAHYFDTGEGPVLSKRIEITAMRAGGKEFPIELTITPFVSEGQTFFTAYLRDISERKQVEEALRQARADLEMRVMERTAELRDSEKRYQRIAANLPGMVFQCVMRTDGSVTLPFVSEGCREIYQVEPAEIEQNPALILEIVHPDDKDEFHRTLSETMTLLTPWKWEGRVITRSGQTK